MWLGTRLRLVLRCRAGTGQAAAPGHLQIPPWPLHPPALPQSHPTCGFWGPTRCAPHTPGPAAPFLVLTAPAPALLVAADEGVAKQHQDQQGQPQAQDEPEHTDGLLPCKPEGEGALQTPAGGWGLRASPGEHGAAVGLCHPSPRLRGSPRLSSLERGDTEQLASPRALHGDLLLPPHPLLPRAGKGAEGGVWVTRQDGRGRKQEPTLPGSTSAPVPAPPGPHRAPERILAPKTCVMGPAPWRIPTPLPPSLLWREALVRGGSAPHFSPGFGHKGGAAGGRRAAPPQHRAGSRPRSSPQRTRLSPRAGGREHPRGDAAHPSSPGGCPGPCSPKSLPKCPHGAFLAVPAVSG